MPDTTSPTEPLASLLLSPSCDEENSDHSQTLAKIPFSTLKNNLKKGLTIKPEPLTKNKQHQNVG